MVVVSGVWELGVFFCIKKGLRLRFLVFCLKSDFDKELTENKKCG